MPHDSDCPASPPSNLRSGVDIRRNLPLSFSDLHRAARILRLPLGATCAHELHMLMWAREFAQQPEAAINWSAIRELDAPARRLRAALNPIMSDERTRVRLCELLCLGRHGAAPAEMYAQLESSVALLDRIAGIEVPRARRGAPRSEVKPAALESLALQFYRCRGEFPREPDHFRFDRRNNTGSGDFWELAKIVLGDRVVSDRALAEFISSVLEKLQR